MSAEKVIKIAAGMYDARHTVRRFLGDKYQTQMAPLIAIIKGVAREQKMDELHAMMRLCKETDGFGQAMLMAAYVEMTEPTSNPEAKVEAAMRQLKGEG